VAPIAYYPRVSHEEDAMPLSFGDETPSGFDGDVFTFVMWEGETRVVCQASREAIKRAMERKGVHDPRIAFAMFKSQFGALASTRYDAGEQPPRITEADVEGF
jgi:hypothetical protein